MSVPPFLQLHNTYFFYLPSPPILLLFTLIFTPLHLFFLFFFILHPNLHQFLPLITTTIPLLFLPHSLDFLHSFSITTNFFLYILLYYYYTIYLFFTSLLFTIFFTLLFTSFLHHLSFIYSPFFSYFIFVFPHSLIQHTHTHLFFTSLLYYYFF